MRLYSGWRFVALSWLMMAGSSKASHGHKVISCWKNWLKMTDDNYMRALERYGDCGELANELTGDIREKYRKALVGNLQRSSNYFFDQTEMSPAEVIRVLRSANHLMEFWGRKESDKDGECGGCGGGCTCTVDCPCEMEPSCYDEDDEDEPSSDDVFKWFKKTRLLFYAFIALLVLQFLLLLILFCKVCCTDLLTHFPSCAYETQCCCEEDKEWITKLINECESHLQTQECYPLLLDTPSKKVKSVTAISYGTNIGKRRSRDDDILTDLTPLSSPRIGSDSEFEALMNRRSLRKL